MTDLFRQPFQGERQNVDFQLSRCRVYIRQKLTYPAWPKQQEQQYFVSLMEMTAKITTKKKNLSKKTKNADVCETYNVVHPHVQ